MTADCGKRRAYGSARRRSRVALPGGTVTQFGLAFAEIARQLGVSTSGIANALARAGGKYIHFVDNVSDGQRVALSLERWSASTSSRTAAD